MNILAVALVLGLLVLVHETGHLLAAKLVGIPIERFSIGMGRKVKSFVWRGTEFQLSAIPLGGYVVPRLARGRDYLKIPLGKRVVFVLGGPVMSIAFALPMLALMNLAKGQLTIDALFLATFSQLGDMTWEILHAIITLLGGAGSLSGIVGILAGGGELLTLSAPQIFFFMAAISLSVAVFNLLPIPPLDGGKVLLDCLAEAFPRIQRVYVLIVVAGWLLMSGLVVYATAADVGRMVT